MSKIFDMKNLDASQTRVVSLPADVDILSVAGPGSGKTLTVTHRLGYLVIKYGVLPSRLRAVTFSIAAAKEMRKRLFSLDTSLETIQISTIHGLCRDIIKETQSATLEGENFQCYVKGKSAFKEKKPEIAIVEALVRFLESDSRIQDRCLQFCRKIAGRLQLPRPSSPREVAKVLLRTSERGNPKDILENYIAYQKTKRHCGQYICDAKLPAFSSKYASYVMRLPKDIRQTEFYAGVYDHYCKILTEWKLLDFTDQIIFAHLGLLNCSETHAACLAVQVGCSRC